MLFKWHKDHSALLSRVAGDIANQVVQLIELNPSNGITSTKQWT